jgi:predicted hotdog family 3-hydroxylacyl-ACP dehydratase
VKAELPPIADLLPQAGPMRWLERVVEHDAASTRCLVVADRGSLFRDAAGRIPSWVTIEWMAQCAAVDGGLRLRAGGQAPRPGLFLGSRRITLHSDDLDPTRRWLATARHAAGRGGLLAFDCTVESAEDGVVVAEGRLHVLPGAAPDPGEAS